MIAAVSVAQTTVSIATSMQAQSWNNIANEAAQAGVSYAYSCLKKNGTSYWTNPLKPSTSCTGADNGNSSYITDEAASGESPHYRSSFSVASPDNNQRAMVEGKVELVDTSGTVTKTWVSDKVVIVTLSGDYITQISASGGSYHACAVIREQVYCWGDNGHGQLGNGTTTSSLSPTAVNSSGVLSGKTVTAISAAGAYYSRDTCALANNKAYCWGRNNLGQLGNGLTTDSSVPVAVNTSGVLAGKAITAIASSTDYLYVHTCVIADGKVYCWGSGTYGELGNGTTTNSSVPVAVTTSGVLSGKIITAISGGYDHNCVLADGKAYCWGLGSYLGNGTTTNSSVPVAVDTSGVLAGKTISALSSDGNGSTCAIAENKVYCWGVNGLGQLGNNSTTTSLVPVAVDISGVLSGKTVTAISSGAAHTCAIADGKAYCWGGGAYGAIGNGTTTNSSIPVAVNTSGVLNGKTITSIIAGGSSTCALANGAAYCWGLNMYGELGNGTTTNSSVPVAISPFDG